MQLEFDFEGKEVRTGRSPYFLTRKEAARELEVSEHVITRYIEQFYLLDAIKIKSIWRLPVSSVQYFKDHREEVLHMYKCWNSWIKSQERGVI